MAEKPPKPKKSGTKMKKQDKSVLGSLPATRPERLGGSRATAPGTFEPTDAAAAAASTASTAGTPRGTAGATPKPRAKGAKTTASRTAAAKRTGTAADTAAATARPRATRRKAAGPRTFEPTQAAESAAGAADERAAGVPPAATGRPRPVRAGAPGIAPHDGGERPPDDRGGMSPTDLAVGMIRATGELARVSISAWAEFVRRATGRG